MLEEGAPDFFLFVGNDNDFQGTNIQFNGVPGTSGALDGSGNNDSILLVYRLTLPTYVDPQALAALNGTAPNMLYGTRLAMNGLALGTTQPAMRFLNAQRGWSDETSRRPQLWVDTEWNRIGAGASPLSDLDAHTLGATFGFDLPVGSAARIGATAGYRDLDGQIAVGAPIKAHAWTFGGYAAIDLPSGLYAQGSAAWLGNVKFRQLDRASAYGQTANGRTKGKGWAVSGELGWAIPAGGASITPFVAVDYGNVDLDGYTETGASVSNLIYRDRSFSKLTTSIGGEVAAQWGAIRPALRMGYSFEREKGDNVATVSLASAQHSMATVALPLADTERNSAFSELRIAMRQGNWSGYFAARGRWGQGQDDARINIGMGYSF